MGKYFGTDGFRGTANAALTAIKAYRIGRFIGQYPNGRKNKILIARDTRISGGMLSSELLVSFQVVVMFTMKVFQLLHQYHI